MNTPPPIQAELWYPRAEDRPKRVIVELIDVRAADALKIEYDFERDGWVIMMNRTRDMGWYMDVIEEDQEVAFIPAWNEDEVGS